MSQEDLDQIRKLIRRLSPPEIKQAKALLVVHQKTEPPRKQLDDLEHDWLLDGINKEMQRRGLLGPNQSPTSREAAAVYRDYYEESRHVREGLLRGMGDTKPQPPDLSTLGELAARALADDMATGPGRLSWRTMVRNVPNMLAAVDKSFPSYMECGMLGFWLSV